MPKGILVKEAAERWGLTERSVTGMCRNGKIPGAAKEGGTWYIPADSEKPVDGRVRTGAYKRTPSNAKLPLPVGSLGGQGRERGDDCVEARKGGRARARNCRGERARGRGKGEERGGCACSGGGGEQETKA